MGEPSVLVRRARILVKTVLAGTVALLALLLALFLIVPHESVPEPIIIFWGLFILIAALISGTAAAYLFLTRVPSALGSDHESGAEAGHPGPVATAAEFEELALRLLDGDERRLIRVIVQARGEVLQRDLVATTSFSDAKVSRLLDRLERRGLVVRERQGMMNRVRLTLRQT